MMTHIQKGSRVRAQWLQAQPFGSLSLAGFQTKTTATFQEACGVVRHIRSDSPTEAVNVTVHIESDFGELCSKCGVKEVVVPLSCIVEVL